MSLLPGVNSPAITIDDVIQNSSRKLEWIPCSQITDIEPTQIDNIYYANCYGKILVFFGNSEECTPTLVSEFSRIYSLSIYYTYFYKYHDHVSQFSRYKYWLRERNELIKGFTKYEDKFYMVADKPFYYCYSRYGFCAACGILRCSPVWCICGHKELSNGWTSNNEQLDEFVKKSQLQTSSANDAYLEWIPFDCIRASEYRINFYGPPLDYYHSYETRLTPLEITDGLVYDKLCNEHPDILATNVWLTIGFTYDTRKQKYCLIKCEDGLCLTCTSELEPKLNPFCVECKAPNPSDWTTGNKPLDLFIMESWSNVKTKCDAYIQWVEYSLLTDVQEMASLHHGCTHTAKWLDVTVNKWTKVTLKQIGDTQSLDFHQIIKKYPKILTGDNIWIIGITQTPSTQEYYLVFFHDIHAVLDKFTHINRSIKYMQYDDFYELKEIGSGGYGTIYTAKYRHRSWNNIIVLKHFKNFDDAPEIFISELRNYAKCARKLFLKIYGFTQDPETKTHMIVMQYANNGNLLSYLDQNINNLTWRMKLQCLTDIARYLNSIHDMNLVHCDLHGGNIVMHDNTYYNRLNSYICDLGLSQSVNFHQQHATIQSVLPFTAPEVFHTRKFTQKSDIYSFGIIMYLIATGEQPFRDRQLNASLVSDIMAGLRPTMPDSAPEEYKKLAELCCDTDPDTRPDALTLWCKMDSLYGSDSDESDDSAWNTIYHNSVRARE